MIGFLVAAVIVAALSAYADWRTGHIPNWITLGALVLAPIAHTARAATRGIGAQAALVEGGFSILGVVVCSLIPLFLYRQNALGGGDVKLFAALGGILQPVVGFEAMSYGFFAAALIAPARLAYEGKLLNTLRNVVSLAVNPFLPKAKRREIVPEAMSWFRMGPAIFLGVVVTAFLHWRTP